MPGKDDRNVIHLFKDEKAGGEILPNRRVIRQYGYPVVMAHLYYGYQPTLCGVSAAGPIYVFSHKQLAEVPLFPDKERMCKRCMKSPDAALRMLSTI